MFAVTLLMTSLAPLVLGAPASLLPCSTISGTPCRCPIGTDYSESVSTAIIGATATDVGHLTNNFFNPLWAGIEPYSVQGPDNFPGLSIRDSNISTAVGVYGISERLTFRFIFPDGSFEQKFEQRGTIPYYSGNGSFSGHWVTLKGDRIFENQTLVRFSNYACNTGHPIDFATFHENALINATSILTASGVIGGISTEPISAQAF
ncbi:hypothetical protein HD806DRAFT_542375 [Xylariaceae sp. AK1471]|nr:hypothetical protein HD806DRAFT_542375 [Xylariaceae sp. AK1471]